MGKNQKKSDKNKAKMSFKLQTLVEEWQRNELQAKSDSKVDINE